MDIIDGDLCDWAVFISEIQRILLMYPLGEKSLAAKDAIYGQT